jgi:hypothetical protein
MPSSAAVLTPSNTRVSTPTVSCAFTMVGGGFEPPKAMPADLQSAPFDRFGTPPSRAPERSLPEHSSTSAFEAETPGAEKNRLHMPGAAFMNELWKVIGAPLSVKGRSPAQWTLEGDRYPVAFEGRTEGNEIAGRARGPCGYRPKLAKGLEPPTCCLQGSCSTS